MGLRDFDFFWARIDGSREIENDDRIEMACEVQARSGRSANASWELALLTS